MNIANKPGAYKNFSGWIKYSLIDCKVKSATFEILEKAKRFKGRLDIRMIFYSGTVTGGYIWSADIKNCNFHGSRISDSVFHNGIFDGDEFIWSYWCGGIWKGGEWINGFDKFGCEHIQPPPFDKADIMHSIISKTGRYKNFNGFVEVDDIKFFIENGNLEVNEKARYSLNIMDGTIIDGEPKNAIIDGVVFKGLGATDCIWYGNTWESGAFEGGVWKDGIWKDGTFYGNIWKNGIWMGGVWQGGIWYGGYDKSGTWHGYDDSPNNWNG